MSPPPLGSLPKDWTNRDINRRLIRSLEEKGVAMNWTELLKAETESVYAVTEKLVAMVEEDALGWKPATGSNWMTTGQLLKHLTESCGTCFRGFVKGEWGMPDGVDISNLPPESMLPPADKLPAVASLAEASRLLRRDKQLAFEMLASCSEEELASKPAPAPWDPTEMVLGHRLLQMIDHLNQHKGQLFYYLKLQGKPVTPATSGGPRAAFDAARRRLALTAISLCSSSCRTRPHPAILSDSRPCVRSAAG